MVVFIGGWRPRRRGGGFFGGSGYGQRGYGPGNGYGPPPGYGYGYRRGNSCLRDVCLIESGCCLAEALGCGPQLALVGPSLVRRSIRLTKTGSSTSAGLAERTRTSIVAAIELYQSEISPNRRAADSHRRVRTTRGRRSNAMASGAACGSAPAGCSVAAPARPAATIRCPQASRAAQLGSIAAVCPPTTRAVSLARVRFTTASAIGPSS